MIWNRKLILIYQHSHGEYCDKWFVKWTIGLDFNHVAIESYFLIYIFLIGLCFHAKLKRPKMIGPQWESSGLTSGWHYRDASRFPRSRRFGLTWCFFETKCHRKGVRKLLRRWIATRLSLSLNIECSILIHETMSGVMSLNQKCNMKYDWIKLIMYKIKEKTIKPGTYDSFISQTTAR